MHLYNSTSVTQRRVVFRLDRDGITELAVRGARLCKELAADADGEIVFQYSPESFHHTELDYALEICEAVAEEWGPTPEAKMIVNLPTTVEQFPPNVYADRIEWFGRNFSKRDATILSVHPHNDRGTAVATAELGLMAGAERVEGTLFGNGERTGNVDLITIALNLLTQGVDPRLDLSAIDEARAIVEECNELPVHPRHPYVGELVYTAFSGSHQDAIKKGMHAQERSGSDVWDVPYLSIDPKDVGRTYEAIIRVNSQSGQGRRRVPDAGRAPPRPPARAPGRLRAEGAGDRRRAWRRADPGRAAGDVPRPTTSTTRRRFELVGHSLVERGRDRPHRGAPASSTATSAIVEGEGNGPIDALVDALSRELGVEVHVLDYHEHAMGRGEDATAAAYVEADVDGEVVWGVGIHSSIVTASLRAVVNAANRGRALRASQDAAAAAFDA